MLISFCLFIVRDVVELWKNWKGLVPKHFVKSLFQEVESIFDRVQFYSNVSYIDLKNWLRWGSWSVK
jgi:hypothetical protein